MPTYEYECSGCGHRLEEFQWFSEAKLTDCPGCGGKTLVRLISGGAGFVVKGSPTTLGQQAEQNARRVGKEGMEKMAEESKSRVSGWKGPIPEGARPNTTGSDRAPWFRDGSIEGLPVLDKMLDLAKVKDVAGYIAQGKVS